ncbi:hypothetical protein [uncultured Capnocytophaga sp.]|uniref:hypothetical protein n=1 Tax=uncultured Capnocytophaga sp. TaxID=159273 RepID=UPI002628CBAC|nr:hypothetical protein [uncultured Capnocytophaga sp.]
MYIWNRSIRKKEKIFKLSLDGAEQTYIQYILKKEIASDGFYCLDVIYGDYYIFPLKLNLKCKTTKNNVINSYKEDYFFDRKIREDRVLDDLDRLFQN